MRRTASASVAVSLLVLSHAGLAGARLDRESALAGQAGAPNGTAVLSGVVTSGEASPQPVRRATVRLTGNTLPSARLVGTDDAGRFAFDALPAGSFTLSVSKPGFVETFHGSRRPGAGPGVPVAVADGARVEVALSMLPGAVITGLVQDAFGRPARSVDVMAVEVRAGGSGTPSTWRASTDDRGQYRIFGLPPGAFLVAALPSLPRVDGGAPARVIDEALLTTDAEARWGWAAVSGAGGAVTAPRAAPPSGRPAVYPPVYYPGTISPSSAAPVSVGVGEERSGVSMALHIVPVARLEGVLVDANGQPVSPATVSVHPGRTEQPSLSDQLVAAGALTLPRATLLGSKFIVAGLAAGDYTLVARSGSATQRARVDAPPPAERLWAMLDVSVSGADQTGLVLRFARGGQLAGEVRFEGSARGRPDDLTRVELSLAGTGTQLGPASRPRAVVDDEGALLFESIAPGAYVLQATLPAAVAAAGWTLKSAVLNDRDIADVPIAFEPGSTDLRGLAVTFTDRPAAIAGRLVDTGGRPVTRYAVVVVTTDRSLWRPGARRVRAVSPATDGTFRVDGLPVGEYALAAVTDMHDVDLADPEFLSGVLELGFALTLADGETVQQDLQVGGG